MAYPNQPIIRKTGVGSNVYWTENLAETKLELMQCAVLTRSKFNDERCPVFSFWTGEDVTFATYR